MSNIKLTKGQRISESICEYQCGKGLNISSMTSLNIISGFIKIKAVIIILYDEERKKCSNVK